MANKNPSKGRGFSPLADQFYSYGIEWGIRDAENEKPFNTAVRDGYLLAKLGKVDGTHPITATDYADTYAEGYTQGYNGIERRELKAFDKKEAAELARHLGQQGWSNIRTEKDKANKGRFVIYFTGAKGKKMTYTIARSAVRNPRGARKIGRKPNSPFITFPSREMANAFAAAAKAAGHGTVMATTHKGSPGVLLGNMSAVEAEHLAKQLRKRFPKSGVAVKNPSLKAIAKKAGAAATKLGKRLKASVISKAKKLTPAGRRSAKTIKRLTDYDAMPKGKRVNPNMHRAPGSQSILKTILQFHPEDLVFTLSSHAAITHLRKAGLTGIRDQAPTSLGSKTRIFTADDTIENRQILERYKVPLKGPKKANPGKAAKAARRKRNPGTGLAGGKLFEEFHGRPSDQVLEIENMRFCRKEFDQLGTLTELKVVLNPFGPKSQQRLVTLAASGGAKAHSDKHAVHLCATLDRSTMYFQGGDQSLNLQTLGFTKKEDIKDLMVIGELDEVTYRTQKDFDKFKTLDYFHGLGEVTGKKPVLLYSPRDKRMMFAGGQYLIKREGITN